MGFGMGMLGLLVLIVCCVLGLYQVFIFSQAIGVLCAMALVLGLFTLLSTDDANL